MGPKTPLKIKERVIKLWLLGYSRAVISRKVGTSVGNILNIVNEAKKSIPDIVLLREVAVQIRKQGWTQDLFAWAIRHRNFLSRKGLSEEQIEDLIQIVDVECFKRDVPMATFIRKLQNLSLVSIKYGCTIEKLDELMREKESDLNTLETKVNSKKLEYSEILSDLNALEEKINSKKLEYSEILYMIKAKSAETKQDSSDDKNTIEKLRQEKNGLENLLNKTKQVLQQELSRYRITSAPEGMDIPDVKRVLNLISRDPPYFAIEIRSVLIRANELSNRTSSHD